MHLVLGLKSAGQGGRKEEQEGGMGEQGRAASCEAELDSTQISPCFQALGVAGHCRRSWNPSLSQMHHSLRIK